MGFFRRILRILKKVFQPLMAAALACFILALTIMLVGARFGYANVYPFRDESIRSFVAITLVFIGCVLLSFIFVRWLYRLWRARQARLNEPERQPTPEEKETVLMDKVFEKVIGVIGRRWSGRKRGAYNLPWYIVAGPQGSGKSSLVETSDLRFPIDHEIAGEIADLKPSVAANAVQWRVAGNEAVLLDTSGELFGEAREGNAVREAVWNRLLHNLYKYRPRRPINGVIVTLDFVEFAAMSYGEREQLAATLRREINELVERLGTQITIHIVFTKIDLAGGFPDYFDSLSGAEREHLFGFHFLFEGQHAGVWTDQFTASYRDFIERLHLHIQKRLFALKNTRSRQEAFSLYRSFLGLEAPLVSFLNAALAPDKFTTVPLVRGIYFASSRQENVPRNVFLEAVGERYGLVAPLYGSSQAASYPYFTTSILRRAVFPEAGLAGNNIRVEKRYKRNVAIAASVGLVVLLASGFYWLDRYRDNVRLANTVLDYARGFVAWNEQAAPDATGAKYLEPLNTIRQATFAFGDYNDINPVAGQLTLYQGHEIGPIADAAYRTILNAEFAPELLEGLERRLRDVCPKGSDAELDLLRVYRMMGNLEGRDDRVIDAYFTNLWQANYTEDATTQNALKVHLDHMLVRVPEEYRVDESVITRSQANLGALAPYQRVYASLRALADRQLPEPLEFRSATGAAFDIVYRGDPSRLQNDEDGNNVRPANADDACGTVSSTAFSRKLFEIPRFFSKQEYLNFFVPQNERVARVAADDLWVLGQLETTDYSEADYAAIQTATREAYVEDYIAVWRDGLNEMQVREFGDIREAMAILFQLSGNSNPIRRIAQFVRDNTQIYETETELVAEDAAAATKLPFDPNREAGLRINSAFSGIDRMLQEGNDGGSTNMEEIQAALIALYDYMKTIQDAASPDARALELAIERAKLTGDDPIFILQRIAERAPAPFDRHLKTIAQQSWKVIMEAATSELNRRWHEEIYGEYQRLIAGKYPFDRNASIDLPLQDFETFFRPGGVIESFYNKELLTFVDGNTGEPKEIDGQILAVDPAFARQLRSAIEITRSFFDQDGALSVEFQVSTMGMSANLARATLNFEGQIVASSHGPSRPVTIVWPNIIDGPVASRIDISPLRGGGAQVARQWDGPWSWLQLYDAATKSNVGNNSVDISFANNNRQFVTFRIRAESRTNLFFNSPLTNFELPPFLRRNTS